MAEERDLVAESLALLPPRDRRKYRLAVGLQMCTSLLDMAGVLLFGVVGVLAAAAAQRTAPPAAVESVLSVVGLSDAPIGTACLVLALVAALLLVVKSVVTVLISRRVSLFLARCSAELAGRLCADFFALPLVRIQKFDSQWSGFALSHGVSGAVVDVLSNAMVFRVEVALLVVLGAALLFVDPVTTIFAIAYFALVVWFFSRFLSGWSRRAGKTLADTDVAAISSVHDAIATYREVTVSHRRAHYVEKFADLRRAGAGAYADQQFIGLLPRYGMEVALVVGAGLLVGVLLTSQSAEAAAGSLALFLTAATRVMPSLLRLNGARITLHGLRARAEYAYVISQYVLDYGQRGAVDATEGDDVSPISGPDDSHAIEMPVLDLMLRDVSVAYPDAPGKAVDRVSFSLPAGASLALVGPSGAGKTTLVDAILGIVELTDGVVRVAGEAPGGFVANHPGLLAYVPQAVALVSGTVRENVALGIDPQYIEDAQVWHSLERANLASFLSESRDGLDTAIGERGVKLSGGQRQRLGIARAMYSTPRFLVMDEATSALDAETEDAITQMLNGLGRDVTTVTVAHRLATIRRADLVLYMEDGKVLCSGTFQEVRDAIPQFDRQAELLGL